MDINGDWTDLMGGIVKEDVDIGVDKIIATVEKIDYITFTQDILTLT